MKRRTGSSEDNKSIGGWTLRAAGYRAVEGPGACSSHGRAKNAVYFLFLLAVLGGCAHSAPPIPPLVPAAPSGEVETSLFLIGDAGSPSLKGEPVLMALSVELAKNPEHSLVVFLGDNIYPRGLPDSTAEKLPESERRLDAQIDAALNPGARAVFIPGNHDYGGSGDRGLASLLRQARHISRRGSTHAQMLPEGGCPGPAVLDVGENLRLVFLDTEWWLRGEERLQGSDSGCAADGAEAVEDSLRAVLATAGDRAVVVMGHHPLASGGPHGGYFPWTEYVFPLRVFSSWLWIPIPIIGAIYPLSRKWGISDQDVSGSANETMRQAFERAFADHPPLLYAAGHEHLLQVLEGKNARYLAVSGAGIFDHASPASSSPATRFMASAAGFMRLDVLKNGRVRLAVYEVNEKAEAEERFSIYLQ